MGSGTRGNGRGGHGLRGGGGFAAKCSGCVTVRGGGEVERGRERV